jgi:sugar/nucleoside kinase (ribokinase family)
MVYLDVFVPRFTPPAAGQELFVDSIKLGFGGAANSASVGVALGLKVTLCVPMGGGITGHAMAQLATRLGIALEALPANDDPAISLVLADATDRAFVSAADFSALDQVTRLPAATWIHVPGLEEAARLTAPLRRARLEGARIAVSGSWVPHRLAQLACQGDAPWDLLILNESEAMAACGNAAQAPQLLTGAARSVVVTMGPAGAFGILDGESVQVAARPVNVSDPTGAGDAFSAGLLAALIRGMPAQAALKFGASTAAHMLQQRGGVLHDPARVAALVKEIPWKY